MDSFDIKEIEIDQLLLDVENPRYSDVQRDQEEAVVRMIQGQGRKLVNLAKDILENGINPSELPIVIPAERIKGCYIVLEGNRRVAAVKLLLNPELIPDSETRYKRRFSELSEEYYQGKVIEYLQCVVYEKREQALQWIELRHTGENRGVGIVRWDTGAKERFIARFRKKSYALQVVDFYLENANLDDKTREGIKTIAITNLDRIVSDPDIRRAFGFDKVGDDFVPKAPVEEILKPLTKVFNDLLEKKIKVGDVYYKADRLEYLKSFTAVGLADQPTSTDEEVSDEKKREESKPAKRRKPASTARNRLIPTSCVLEIDHHRINDIYQELRRLNVDQFPNAVAITFRVFLDVSLDYFIEKNNITRPRGNELKKRLSDVADYIEKKQMLSKSKLKPIRVAVSDLHSLLAPNTLNAYVHSRDMEPIPDSLKRMWNNFQPFIEKLWE